MLPPSPRRLEGRAASESLFQAFLNCTAGNGSLPRRRTTPLKWRWALEGAHELVCTKDRTAALLSGGRPRHLCHVAGPVGDPGDSGGPCLLIGFVEGWSVGDAVYFTFITSLTIGYGDIVPRQALGRALAVGIGICGLFLTGVIAGIAVYAMRRALGERDTG